MKIIMSAIYGFWIPWSFDQVLGSGLICQSGKNTLRPKLPDFQFMEIFWILGQPLDQRIQKCEYLAFIQSESI